MSSDDYGEGEPQSEGGREISISLLPLLAIIGLAIVGYAVGGLLGLGLALLAIPAAYVFVILVVLAWGWFGGPTPGR